MDLGGNAMEKRKSDRKHVYAGILLSCVLLLLTSAGASGLEPTGPTAKDGQATTAAPPNEMTVALKEIPVWQVHGRVRGSFLAGLPSLENLQGDPRIRYPALKSGAPLYGRIPEWYLPAASRGGDGNDQGGLAFVLDRSADKPKSYDLLYFDENADGDLTNDTPRKVLKDAPAGLSSKDDLPVAQTWFESVKLKLPAAGAGPQVIELLPCTRTYEGRTPVVRFIPVQVHTGRFEVNGQSYEAFLGYEYTLTASLNDPSTALRFVSQDGKRASYLGVERLNAMPVLGGKYHRFSCTPTGDQLLVQRYNGPLGVLELGPGNRDIQGLQMMGELQSRTAVIGIGYDRPDEKGMPQGVRRCEIPVGDYCPSYMTVSLGKIRFAFSDNYYQSVSGQTGFNPEARYNMAIRAEKPFVLDFSNKPVVTFVRPTANDRVLRGREMRVEAVLVDPVRNIMIRRLDDMSHPEKRSYKTPDGQDMTYEFGPSLDPKVTIARANGEIVAESTMPFG
jgi:hypothetical protein